MGPLCRQHRSGADLPVSGPICSAFGLHEEALHYLGAPALRLYALSSIGAGVSMVLHTYYRSIHEEQNAFIITLLRNFVILLPCTVFFATSLPQFWWLYPVTELLSLLLLFVWRCLTGRERLFDAARVYSLTMHGSSREFTAMAGGIAAFCDRWQAAPRQRYFVSMAAAESCSAFLEQAPGHIAEIQITLVALEDGDFELHIRDNTDFFDSFSAQADRLGGKGTLDIEPWVCRSSTSRPRSSLTSSMRASAPLSCGYKKCFPSLRHHSAAPARQRPRCICALCALPELPMSVKSYFFRFLLPLPKRLVRAVHIC